MNMMAYDHKKIEKKWQEFWSQNRIYTTPDQEPGKENFYLLVEFPYPSGNLHVGHWYAFAIPDILARAMRMQGKNVMYPIGFDAFGLPAENAAIKNKLNPRDWTEKNIAYMTQQIESMGTSFDWSRKVSTIDPKYYKWTQWLFLQLYKKGLVYQKETAVNWCPNDKTVLANEQVVDGKCERCGYEVVQRQMLQWNIKITEYADRLIDDLAALDWPEQIKESQRNWIGRSEGAEIDFVLNIEAANTSKPNFLLLHGKGGSSRDKFFPWLRKRLEEGGHTVQVPDLPNSPEPNDEEQTDYVLGNCTINENTVVLGHSFGGIVALRLAERGVKTRMTILAATPFSGKFKDGKDRPTVTAAVKKGFDSRAIKKNTGNILVLAADDDHAVPHSDAEAFANLFDTKVFTLHTEKSHFGGEIEPDLLRYCEPTITVFTTRPDTLFGATYLVLAPEHPFIQHCCESKACTTRTEVDAYVKRAMKKTELERQADTKEKTGVKLEGVMAVNPATGEKIPLYVADYVLGHYGSGAIMAVPAHDERDYEFAKKFDLPMSEVIAPVIERHTGDDAIREGQPFVERNAVVVVVKHWSEEKYICLARKKDEFRGFVTGGIEKGEGASQAALREVIEETGYQNPILIRSLGQLESKFFHKVKNENRLMHAHAFLVKLADSACEEISAHEKELHDVVWVDADEVETYINRADMKEVWKRVRHEGVFSGDGVVVNSGDFNGMTTTEAKRAITEKYGRVKKTYRLRDWIVSRQRYWGVPIPIVHCAKCGAQPVPDEQLPVELPPVEDYLPEGSGKSPLAKVSSFVNTTCPTCGGPAERETDTLDTFVDSSWYFNRYVDPQNDAEFASKDKQEKWMPVDLYSGGAEHTTMHLLYSRFWHKALFDCGLVKDPEPYARRMNRSIILGPDGQKMSKSRGNVIDPDEVVERLGADTVRLYLAFIGPYNEVASYPWNPDGVVGVRRFLERVWKLQEKLSSDSSIESALHKAIKKISEDIPKMKFNTAISAMMILVNEAEKKGLTTEQYRVLLRLLAPFAPHITEELWHKQGMDGSIHEAAWPAYDESKLTEDTIVYAIQIDGKTRGEVSLAADLNKEDVEAAAREAVADRLAGKEVARVIVVPKRLVNFVMKD